MKILTLIFEAIKRRCQGPMTDEQVAQRLTEAAAEAEDKNLDWKHSVVDLLKALNLPSDLQSRQELAVELGYLGPLDGSAQMNTELHALVMKDVKERSIKVPEAGS